MNLINKRALIICGVALFSLCATTFFPKDAHGVAWTDDGNDISVGSGTTEDCKKTSNSTWGNCLGMGWVYYEYYKVNSNEHAKLAHHGKAQIPTASSTNITVKGNDVASKCGKAGGFYNLGYIVNKRYKKDGKIKMTPVKDPYFQKGSFEYDGNEWRNTFESTRKINKYAGFMTKLTDSQEEENKECAKSKTCSKEHTDGKIYTRARIWASHYETKKNAYAAFKDLASNAPSIAGLKKGATDKQIKEKFNNTATFCYGEGIKTEPEIEDGEFKSRSKVAGPEEKIADIDYSEPDDEMTGNTVYLDYTKESAKVTFRHLIRTKKDDLIKKANPSTDWVVSQSKYQDKSSVAKGSLSVKKMTGGTDTTVNEIVSTNDVVVKVAQGKKVTVCQTVTYKPKTFYINEETEKVTKTSGKGSSKACITVKRGIDKPTPPPSSASCPLPGFDHTINYGNTVAESVVKNYSTTGWQTSVFAKPGDEVQFRHTLCAGAQTVTASWSNGAPRRTGDVYAANWFYLKADASGYGTANNYLFNRKHLENRVTFDRLTNRPSQIASIVNPEETYVGNTYFWGFRLYSPKNSNTGGATSYASNDYSCAFYNGSLAQAFQIPGFAPNIPNDCKSKNLYSSPSSLKEISRSNVGHTISQSLVYNDVKAWVDHQYSSPSCGCDRYSSASTWYVGYPGGNGYMRHTCVPNGICYDYRGYNYSCNCHWVPRSETNCYGSGENRHCYTSHWSDYVCSTCHQIVHGDANRLLNDYDMHYPISVSDPQTQKTATVKVPYNFITSTEASIEGNDDVVYAGETANAHYNVSIDERTNPDVDSDPYLTMTPNDTLVQLMSFTINANMSAGEASSRLKTNGVSAQYETLPGYLSRVIGTSNGVSNFQVINGYDHGYNQAAINGEGLLSGPVKDQYNGKTYSSTIPDVEPGSKFCVVVGINHADSHGIPGYESGDLVSGQGGSGYSLNGASRAWRVSSVSCRTIAKKPNFQVWGGVYSQGRVYASQSPKETFGGGDHVFGSWSDTIAIGANAIYQFASGSALGYAQNGGGSASKNTSYCNMIKMTIANDDRFACQSQRLSGYAGTFSEISDNLEKILSRYTPEVVTTQPEGYDVGSYAALVSADTLNNGGKYTYVNGDADVNSALLQTSGTRVIHINGTLRVHQNICTGTGTCTAGWDSSIILSRRNNQSLGNAAAGNIDDIPQVIIIADNVEIDQNVTQIDAWIFARNGEVNTCTAGREDTSTCNKTIIFNGPIFASGIRLNRTAGAYPGRNATGRASANQDLASAGRGLNNSGEPTTMQYGSATPGEIFNLRPDAYFWAYNQANRLSQATVVYMRELAPRY